MDTLDRATKVLTKLVEVAHWIGAVGMLVGLALTFLLGEGAVVFGPESFGTSVKIYGLELVPVDAAGALHMGLLRTLLVGGFFELGLMAMVFRNCHLVLKNSEGTTPFQPDNVRMVREIGIFLIAQPVVALVVSVAARLVADADLVESGVNMAGILIGLVVLCLSRIFARGMTLESDVDGLV